MKQTRTNEKEETKMAQMILALIIIFILAWATDFSDVRECVTWVSFVIACALVGGLYLPA